MSESILIPTDKKTVLTYGNFDILHAGHIELFKYCKTRGNRLIVGVYDDASVSAIKGPSFPINTLESRISLLKAQIHIDYVVVINNNLESVLESLAPDVIVKGSNHAEVHPSDKFARQIVIYDIADKPTSSSIINKILTTSRKTVIHVWKQGYANREINENLNFFGIGDMLRGAYGLYHLSKKYGFDLIIDTSNHPIGRFLKQRPHRFSQYIKDNLDTIRVVWPVDVESYLETNLKKNGLLCFFTNMDLRAYNFPFTYDARDFIKTLLEPSAEFDALFQSVYKSLPYHDYTLIHYRLGDDEIVRGKQPYDMEAVTKHMMCQTDLHSIAISDSSAFKAYIKGRSPHVHVFDGKSGHIGYSDDVESLTNTMLELFLAKKAAKIKSFSTYEWVSGFMFLISKAFDIHLESQVNLKFPKISN